MLLVVSVIEQRDLFSLKCQEKWPLTFYLATADEAELGGTCQSK